MSNDTKKELSKCCEDYNPCYKISCVCHQSTPSTNVGTKEEDLEDTLREIIYSNWKKGDEVGLYVAVRSLLSYKIQQARQEEREELFKEMKGWVKSDPTITGIGLLNIIQ